MADSEEFTQTECGRKVSRCCCIPQRVVLALMGSLGIVCCYLHRICLSHAITIIVIKETKNKTDQGVCPVPENQSEHDHSQAIYDWSQNIQGIALGSFFLGYLLTHLPGGILTDKYGGKWVLWVGMLVSTIMTLCTPVTIKAFEAVGLILLRFTMGLGQGVVFPSLSGWLSSWVPANERGKLGALVMGSGTLGGILGNFISGQLLKSYKWPILFYVFGIVTLVWLILLIFLCYSYPRDHPYIKETEVEFLRSELGHIGKVKKPMPPWRAIIFNCPMAALVIAQLGHDWGLFVIVIDLPKYMSDVLNLDSQDNGIYTSLPFVAMWITSIICGFLSDCLIGRNILSLGVTRKLMTLIAAVGPGAFMVIASYCGCHRELVGSMFTISMGTMGPYFSGMKLTPLDMSPNYAGTLMAISNGLGAIMGYLAPLFIGLMTPNTSLSEWRIVFWVSFAILTISAIVFCFWGTGDRQAFDDIEKKPKE